MLLAAAAAAAWTVFFATPVPRSAYSLVRRIHWEEHVRIQTQGASWKRLYRVSYSVFVEILDLVRPALERQEHYAAIRGSAAILPEVQLATTLHWLAGASYVSCHVLYGFSKPTFYAIVERTIAALNAVPELRLPGFPKGEEVCGRLAHEWKKHSARDVFSHCVGAVVSFLACYMFMTGTALSSDCIFRSV